MDQTYKSLALPDSPHFTRPAPRQPGFPHASKGQPCLDHRGRLSWGPPARPQQLPPTRQAQGPGAAFTTRPPASTAPAATQTRRCSGRQPSRGRRVGWAGPTWAPQGGLGVWWPPPPGEAAAATAAATTVTEAWRGPAARAPHTGAS